MVGKKFFVPKKSNGVSPFVVKVTPRSLIREKNKLLSFTAKPL